MCRIIVQKEIEEINEIFVLMFTTKMETTETSTKKILWLEKTAEILWISLWKTWWRMLKIRRL